MSRATTLVSVNQQLAISAGVAVGAFAVEATMMANHFAPGASVRTISARLHRGRHSVGALGHLVLEIAGRCGS